MTTFSKEENYKVRLDLFEGPLDLLLYLIKKNEVDIYDIPIEMITEQYLEYLSVLKELNLNNVGEFILLASQLIYIKSQLLLPEDERGDMEEFEDPRMELVNQLLEYRKFKNAAISLDALQKEEAERYPRLAKIHLDEMEEASVRLNTSIFELLEAFSSILKSRAFDASLEIEGETVTVADKISEIRERLGLSMRLTFTEIFHEARSRIELICSFLALLELIKSGEISAIQTENFGEILIQKNLG
ncbi:MAG: segregation/condensation protein A [Candidatus Aureabacteria bacterium]|nr:segregation/condensation protein A [Candidatus Auribacterota bacterium]